MEKVGNSLLDGLLKTSGWGAVAAALAMMALPAEALAQDRSRSSWRSSQRTAEVQRNDDGRWHRSASTQSQRSNDDGGDWQSRRAQSRQEQSQTRQVQSQSGRWQNQSRTNRTAPVAQDGNAPRSQAQANARPQNGSRSGTSEDRSYNRGDRARDWQRNQTYSNHDRNRTYRDDRRDNDWRNQRESWRDSPSWRSDRQRSYKGEYRRWDRNWRSNSRYAWRDYRTRYHDRYRLGRYYSPYRGYSYSRLYVGIFLDSLFYSSRYWIDDPWYYRLPPAYGPYRWVRYYDDALLVDIYTGEVIDVIYDFFW